jgi:arsenate reductase (thioredoxin)
MAHGYLQYFGGEKVKLYSAGVEVHGVNPIAVGVMAEDGVDITKHTSNHIDEYMDEKFDIVLTVCDNAKETCPYFPTTAKMIHHSFPDPAAAVGTVKEILADFRKTRGMIREFCEKLIQQEVHS